MHLKSIPKFLKRMIAVIVIAMTSIGFSFAVSRTTVTSGNWNISSTWSPSGSPSPGDNVTIEAGHTVTVNSNQTVHHVTVNHGATLTWSSSSTLSVTGNLTVNGTVAMNGGNITLTSNGLQFNLGSNSMFTWEPGNNTAAAATLFTNGVESFSATSTLIIKKWYNFSVPLPSLISGNFGNLELNTYNGTVIPEWNQNNGFEIHQVLGTLSVDLGWITLDKSGSISQTTIGKIILKNVNSTLYGHNGTHPSFFTIKTSSITNNGGIFYGLSDGNGDINVHVAGNFTNTGNVKIINNSGIAGVSNGNATLKIDSTYAQSAGDTRIIYNVSSTNSGLFTAGFRSINLSGGIFMGQSGCRTSGGVCSLSVAQDLIINFQNNASKFRGTSISSIGASKNAVGFSLTVGRNFSVAGAFGAEVTSAASSGKEDVTVTGTTSISGCNTSFNYGSPNAAHSNSLTLNGNVSVTGGIVFLSRNDGAANIAMNGNLILTAGQLTVKGGDSATTMIVRGTYTQSGGQFYIHNNSTSIASVPFSINILDNFTHSGGTFCFDSNPVYTAANHSISLSGAGFTVSGNSSITRAGAGVCSSFGQINFKRIGTINYSRNSTAASITQVKQYINSQCIVKVINGNFLVSSFPSLINDLSKVNAGGTLNTQGSQIISNGTYPFSSITLDSNATLTIQRTQGLYNGTTGGSINPNMNFNLHPYSIVEYNGSGTQALTGDFSGALPVQNQYGILKINMQSGSAKAAMTTAVSVRTKLILTNGELNLGGNTLTLFNGAPVSMTRTNGFINCELTNGIASGKVTWKNMSQGFHEFAFGTDASAYLPVQFFLASGVGTDVSISTYATSASDNLPLPLINGSPVNFSGASASFASTDVVDRWWIINAPGVTGGLVVKYRAIENSIDAGLRTGSFGFIRWTGTNWDFPSSTGTGVTSGIGTVAAEGMSEFSAIAVSHSNGNRSASTIQSYYVEQVGEEVSINWSTENERNYDFFTVERSADGYSFEEVSSRKSAGNSSTLLKYNVIDANPITGKSYYRVKVTGLDRSTTYSTVQEINISSRRPELSIESSGPNPFIDNFHVNYQTSGAGIVKFELRNSSSQMVHQSQSNESDGSHRFEYIKGGDLQKGVYFLKIQFGDKSVIQKLIKN